MKRIGLCFIILILLAGIFAITSNIVLSPYQKVNAQTQEEFCDGLSDPTHVCIAEEIEYFKITNGEDRPRQVVSGYLQWWMLDVVTLGFFVNTSDLIGEIEITDPKNPSEQIGFSQFSDRFIIRPPTTQFQYVYTAYYDPDVVGDTGFVVIFSSQIVNFGEISQGGKTIYTRVDYRNKIILPEKAGIVSYAPTTAKLEEEGTNRFSLTWEFRNRAMDSKHDPVLIEVTYSCDDIYLQLTRLIYQNQIERQRQLEEQERLDITNASFQIIAFLAVLFALLSVLVAYLIARRKFEPEKKKAKELPRKQATDIEGKENMEIEVRKLLLATFFLTVIMLSPFASTYAQIEEQDIQWEGTFEIFKDNRIKQTIRITVPTSQSVFRIWENTSALSQIRISSLTGSVLPYSVEDDFILVEDPPIGLEYSFTYTWVPENIGGIFVYLDRFWLEFVNPNNDPAIDDDSFLKADLSYAVILPTDAIIYSASPSEKVTRSTEPDGRKRVQFLDQNRQIDAFHDAWECQVSFSYKTVFEVLEDINSEFDNFQIENKNVIEYIQTAVSNVFIISLLGLIAPLVSFLIAYWIFRKRYLKEIERIQEQQEEGIEVEEVQVESFLKANSRDVQTDIRKSYLGYYYLLKDKVFTGLKRNSSVTDKGVLEMEIKKISPKVDFLELIRLLQDGELIEATQDSEITLSQLEEYSENVETVLKQFPK